MFHLPALFPVRSAKRAAFIRNSLNSGPVPFAPNQIKNSGAQCAGAFRLNFEYFVQDFSWIVIHQIFVDTAFRLVMK